VASRNGRTSGRKGERGFLLPIGGAEDRSHDGVIIERFVEEAGGSKARIAVVPTASEEPDAGTEYCELMKEMGAGSAEIIRVISRDDASSPEVLGILGDATGIYIGGGDQQRLVTLLAGTGAMATIKERNAAGAIIAGTSAGASILGSHMMVNGSGETAPRRGGVEMVAGFGLIPEVVIDQHFSERGRVGRLLTLFAANPGLAALGIDENTGALIDHDGVLEVIGAGSVTVLDGRHVISNYFEMETGELVSITNSSLHVLGPGSRFSLKDRHAVLLVNLDPEQLPFAATAS
jgi:cyanophycinase